MKTINALGRTTREVMTAWADHASRERQVIVAQYLPGPLHELMPAQAGTNDRPTLSIREESGPFIGNREASSAEVDEFYDALQKGQVEILAVDRLTGAREVLHTRTFEPLMTEDELYALDSAPSP